MLRISHNCGFFSCCYVRLDEILKYYNLHKKLPSKVDSTDQFKDYKPGDHSENIVPYFFVEDQKYLDSIDIVFTKPLQISSSHEEPQFSNYRLLNFDDMKPFLKKYFSLSNDVKNCITFLDNKYSLSDINYNNICAIFFRGNDKSKETNQPSYEEMIQKASTILTHNPNIKFLIQTDEREFLEAFLKCFPNNSFYFKEIPNTPKMYGSMQHILPPQYKIPCTQLFVAAIHIIARCKYVIHTSGNCELWIALTRGHANGLYQYLSPIKHFWWNQQLNPSYDPNKTNFWIES